MTIIAWDGATLAADQQMTCAGLRSKCRKISEHYVDGERTIIAFSGTHDCGLALREWYLGGANVADWPKFQSDKEKWTRLVCATKRGIWFYEQEPYSQLVLDPYWACGSARDFAMGAMAQGAIAVRAVDICIKHSVDCGFGVDHFHVREP